MHLAAQFQRIHRRLPQTIHSLSCRHNSTDHNAATSATTTATPAASASDTASSTQQWTPIYKLPLITAFVHLNRLKVYQAALTSLGVPICMGLESASILGDGTAQVFAVLGITGTLALSLASWTVGRNVVGFAYVDSVERPQRLRLSCPDFWGRRRNFELDVESVVPQLDLPRRVPLDLYIKVLTRPSSQTAAAEDGQPAEKAKSFKLAHRHGEIVQPVAFAHVFGEC